MGTRKKERKSPLEGVVYPYETSERDVAEILTCLDALGVTTTCLARSKRKPTLDRVLFKPKNSNEILTICVFHDHDSQYRKEWHLGEIVERGMSDIPISKRGKAKSRLISRCSFVIKPFDIGEMKSIIHLFTREFECDQFASERIRCLYGDAAMEKVMFHKESPLDFSTQNLQRISQSYKYTLTVLRGDNGIFAD